MTQDALQFINVNKSYPGPASRAAVLDQLNLTLPAGERMALLGPSGSGKTTLLNIAAGLETADSGTVRVNGQSLSALDEHHRSLWRRRHVGFIFQAFHLFPQLTVVDNIRVSLRLNHLRGDYWEQRLEELTRRLGINDYRHRLPHQLSGGEQQRVAIARAIIHEPALLLADEPTGNLDENTAAGVLALLAEASAGRALLLVTHSRQAAAIADQVFTLRQGQVDAAGL
ncbi:MAG: ABC transporter ATP-binding protein [Wenzhouxiangellaceae bacterium]